MESNKVVNLLEYVVEKLAENNHIKVYVGTDSQNYGGKTKYATCVVLRYNNRGGHVLYKEEKVDRIKDHWTRLWKEVEFSLEVANFLKEISSINVEAIELDFNNEKKTESNKLVAASKGYITSYGFKVKIKPEELIACKAADFIVRN